MVVSDELLVKVKADVIPLERGIDRANRKIRQVGDEADKSSKKATKSIKGINKAFGALKLAAVVALAAVVLAFTKAIGKAEEFQKQIRSLSTIIDSVQAEKLSQQIRNLSVELETSSIELAAAQYDILSAGITDTAKAMETLTASGKLAKAGLSSTKEAANILTSALNAFEAQGLSAEETANILFKTVKAGKNTVSELAQAFGATAPIVESAGVTLQDFSAATAALTSIGVPASQAQNSLRAAIVALKKPTEDMEIIFKRLGVSSGQELIQTAGGLGEAFKLIHREAEAAGIVLEKATGRVEGAVAITTLATTRNEAYTATLKDMQSGSDALSGAFEVQKSTIEKLKVAGENAFIELGKILGEAFEPALIAITDALIDFTKFLQSDTAKAMADAIRSFLDAERELFDFFKTMSDVVGLGGAVEKLGAIVAQVFDTMATRFRQAKIQLVGFSNALRAASRFDLQGVRNAAAEMGTAYVREEQNMIGRAGKRFAKSFLGIDVDGIMGALTGGGGATAPHPRVDFTGGGGVSPSAGGSGGKGKKAKTVKLRIDPSVRKEMDKFFKDLRSGIEKIGSEGILDPVTKVAFQEMRNIIDANKTPLEVYNERVRNAIELHNDWGLTQEQLNRELDAARRAFEESDPALKLRAEILKEINGDTEQFAKIQETVNRLVDEGTISLQEGQEVLKQYGKSLGVLKDEGTTAADDIKSSFQRMGQQLEDTLVDFVTTGKANFRDLVNFILREIARLAVRHLILKPLSGLFGSIFGGLTSIFTGNAQGGMQSRNVPTVVGEKGPELFVPSNNGRIIPNHKMGSGNGGQPIVINQNFSMGVQEAVRSQLAAEFPNMKRGIEESIYIGMRRGGKLSSAAGVRAS